MADDSSVTTRATVVERLWRWAAVIGICVSSASCGPRYMPAATPAVPPEPLIAAVHYAGTGVADVTPPPGVATFGHGPDARVAAGYSTHLQCRAFVLMAETGSAVAIVPCELAAVSTLLQRSVAEQLQKDGVNIPPQRLFISAVHTHAGPAHYFDAQFYGDVASTQGPGFDPDVLSFMSSKIAGAVCSAYDGARKALQSHRRAKLRWIHGKFWGLTHNRSPAAFALNDDKFAEEPPPDLARDLDPASRAIDPNLDILEIAEQSTTAPEVPVGWIGFLAMHPTVLPNTNRLFGGDVFGITSRILEQELRRRVKGPTPGGNWPLVGLINTNEGDISPRWSTGDREEMITFGRRLADEFLRIYPQHPQFKDEVVISTSTQEVRLPNNTFGLEPGHSLCSHAELGIASFWGASDHPTSLAALGDLTASPVDRAREDCQAPKREALGGLQQIFSGKYSFPTVVPLGVALLDDTWIAFAPAELTSTVGYRIRKALQQLRPPALNGAAMHALIGGLTNGYMEYVATKEEYQLQAYEGASTLYGPHTAEFLRAAFQNIAQRMLGRNPDALGPIRPDVASSIEYEPGPTRARLPRTETEDHLTKPLGTCWMRPVLSRDPPKVCFTWVDGPPSLYSSPPYRRVSIIPIEPHWRRLSMRVQVAHPLEEGNAPDPLFLSDSALVRDDGFEFSTAIRRNSASGWIWATVFQPTPEEWAILRSMTQRVVFQVGTKVQSRSFSFATLQTQMRPCDNAEALLCRIE